MNPLSSNRGVRMALYIAGAASAAVGLFLIYVACQPNDFRVARSQEIAASPADLFPYVNELRRWASWSPYEKLDPTMKKTYEGPAAGTGAKYSWTGDGQVGAGSITITDSLPNEQVLIKLEMQRPFTCANDVTFTFEAVGSQTRVTWQMTGKYAFIPKVMHQFLDLDKMCGRQFAEGLANLKTAAERRRVGNAADTSDK